EDERHGGVLERPEAIEDGEVREKRQLLTGDGRGVLGKQLQLVREPRDANRVLTVAVAMPVALFMAGVIVMVRALAVAVSFFPVRVVMRVTPSAPSQEERGREERCDDEWTVLHWRSPVAARSLASARLAVPSKARRRSATSVCARWASRS